jgi:hypothetical protein
MEPNQAVEAALAAGVINEAPTYVVLHAGDVVIPTFAVDDDTRVRVLSDGTVTTESSWNTMVGAVRFVNLDGTEHVFSF